MIGIVDVINSDALLAGLQWVACVAEPVVVVDLSAAASVRTCPCALNARESCEV
jgi:hypothetical protein